LISSLMSVNSSISHPRLTRGSYTSYFTLQISNIQFTMYEVFGGSRLVSHVETL